MQYNNGSSNNSKQIMSNNSIKDNFITPLTPLHRGGLGGLHKWSLEENLFSYNNNKKENVIASEAWRSREMSSCYKVNNCMRLLRRIFNTPRNDLYAFSLIELSIVLIIIGLLVAGVTGGKSLIESAKTRALMNEIRGYKQAVNTFYVANDRFPGDANEDGIINEDDDGFYDFPAPYNKNDQWGIYIQAPWIELYLDKIIDFEINPDTIGSGNVKRKNTKEFASPHSKVFPELGYDIDADGGIDYTTYPILEIGSDYNNTNQKIFKDIDKKMDDGKDSSGNIFSPWCEYDTDGYECPYIGIVLNFN